MSCVEKSAFWFGAFINWHFSVTCGWRIIVSEFLNGWKSVRWANMGMLCCVSGLDTVQRVRCATCSLLGKMEANKSYPTGCWVWSFTSLISPVCKAWFHDSLQATARNILQVKLELQVHCPSLFLWYRVSRRFALILWQRYVCKAFCCSLCPYQEILVCLNVPRIWRTFGNCSLKC